MELLGGRRLLPSQEGVQRWVSPLSHGSPEVAPGSVVEEEGEKTRTRRSAKEATRLNRWKKRRARGKEGRGSRGTVVTKEEEGGRWDRARCFLHEFNPLDR